jgi:hypothetical protein
LLAIFLLFSPFLGWRAEAAGVESPPFGSGEERSILGAPGDIIIEIIVPAWDTLYPGQTGVSVRVDARNASNTQILVQNIGLAFTRSSPGDRNADYIVGGDIFPARIVNPGEMASFDLIVDVLETALTDEVITVDAYIRGQRLDNFESIENHTLSEFIIDRFDWLSYGGSNGTVDWSGDWQELGESDGPLAGYIMVRLNPVVPKGNSLRLGGASCPPNKGIWRQVDLGGATAAVLSFDWNIDSADPYVGSDIYVQVSDNGGLDWTTLMTISDGVDPGSASESLDISDHLAPDTRIRFIKDNISSNGYIYFDNIQIEFTPGRRSESWLVLSDALTAIVALFDTRLTPDRADDSLMCMNAGEYFQLADIHHLNKGQPLGNIPIDPSGFYRLVVQIHATSKWDWAPKDPGKGFFTFSDTLHAFGLILSPDPGRKEFLLSETILADQEDDTIDFMVGATKSAMPPYQWSMLSDPQNDPLMDGGKTGEWGSLIPGTPPLGMVIDCKDGGKDWEVTGDCEDDRYYFFETWFQPDMDWSPGDNADIYLYIEGNSGDNNIEELHLSFRMVDDDSVGPVFSEFHPVVIPEAQSFDITCHISDPSGVYDDGTGSSGQGVYLIWDNDGDLDNGHNEITMSHIGGGYYITDAQIPPHAEWDEILYAVHACDDDFDGNDPADRSCGFSSKQKVQVVGQIYLEDDPYSSYPRYIYPGQQDVSFHVDITSPMPGGLSLYTTSYLAFTDGDTILYAFLSNETWIEGGASGFPIAFDPIDIPHDFNSPDTLDIYLSLEGLYDGTTDYFQSWILGPSNRLIVLEPKLHFVEHAVPSPSVNPGLQDFELLRMEIACESLSDVVIDSLYVSNVTSGYGGVPETDANLRRLYLYKQGSGSSSGSPVLDEARALLASGQQDAFGAGRKAVGGPRDAGDRAFLESRPFGEGDTLIATAELSYGSATFYPTRGNVLQAFESWYYYVVADVDSFSAADGDSLDLEITSPDSIFITGYASKHFHDIPLNSEGKSIVDGSMSFQFSIGEGVADTLYSGDVYQPVLVIDVPSNGYAPDVLTGLSIKNYGDVEVDDVISALHLWADNGDSLFSNQTDFLVGELEDTGDRFQISGMSQSVPYAERLFVTADFGEEFADDLEIRFGVPPEGADYQSGNDGPLDRELLPDSSQVLIRREYIVIEEAGGGTESATVYPGQEDIELLALRIRNRTLGLITMDTLAIHGDAELFACESAKTVDLYADDGDGTFDAGSDLNISSGSWAPGSGTFDGIGLDIAASGEAVLFVAVDVDSYLTVDDDTLAVRLESEQDVSFTVETGDGCGIVAVFPVANSAAPVTDGMLTHQVTLYPSIDSSLVGQREDILILDLGIPGNGCLDDTLNSLVVANTGSAGEKHISRMLLWRDDGDGSFDPLLDDSLSVFGVIADRTYLASGLNVHLDGVSGGRFFVSVDLTDDFSTGATIRAGVSQMGIAVASGNDGPIDSYLLSDITQIIPIPDRVTFYTSILGNKRVHPGEGNILNMVLGAYNSYTEPKVLESLMLLKGGTSRPEELVEVSAYADSDGDGLFDPDVDSLLMSLESSDAFFMFDKIDMTFAPYKSNLLFITYTTYLRGVRDSVSVDFYISDASFIRFHDERVTIEGEFPLNSAGVDLTDGMVSGQIDIAAVPGGRVSPGDSDIPCFLFRLPCNGTLDDSLRTISIENLGTATPGQDVDYLRLWKEAGGDPAVFDPGLEELIGTLAWDGIHWSSVSEIAELIPCSGLVLHVTADIAPTAHDGRTIIASLPIDGAQVASGNDGPIDSAVASAAVITITTDPLLASFDPLTPVTRQQQFDVRLRVSNEADTMLIAVMPDSFSWGGDGSLSMISGPVPSSIDLPGGSDSSFVWTLLAESPGNVVFSGKGIESGGTAVSELAMSDTLRIEEIPGSFTVTFDDLSPVSINRGREDASLIEIVMSYGSSCMQCAPVDLASIQVLFTDGGGSPQPIGNVASRVSFEDESQVLFTALTTGNTDSVLTIVPDDPVVFSPGEIKTFRVSIDVSSAAAASDFRLQIVSENDISLADHNNGNPVSFTGAVFPWSTSTVTIQDPASELLVAMNATLPPYVNKGQSDVQAFELVLTNSGAVSGADISVSEIILRTRDENGDTIDAGGIFRSFRFNDGLGYGYFSTEFFAGSSTILCTFQPAVTVSPQVPLSLFAIVEILGDPAAGGFSLSLEDSLDVTARDINSGNFVAVAADMSSGGSDFPLLSGEALFFDPLTSFSVSGSGLLPSKVTANMSRVPVLDIALAHTGGAGESQASCDGLTVRIIDQAGHGIHPNMIFEALKIYSGDSILSSVYLNAADTLPDISMPFAGALLLGPGERDTLSLEADISAASQSGFFQVHLNESGIEIRDATDSSELTELDGDFPLTSGVAEIALPADGLFFHADAVLPANVASGGETGVFDLHFDRDGFAGSSLVFIEQFSIEILDGNDTPVDPSLILESVQIQDGGGSIPVTLSFLAQAVQIDFADPPALDEDGSIDMNLAVRIKSDPQVRIFSARIGSASDVQCSDEMTGNPVAVNPSGGTAFPYLSGRSALLGNDMAQAFANYPNPFVASREKTTITFYLPSDGVVTLKLYTIGGRPVKTLLNGDRRTAGLHQDVAWDGMNTNGKAVLNGVYYLVNTTVINGKEYEYKRKVAVVW